ncbi:MAG: MarR family winged helix-turn-helix transcriptional regulator [Actinomycetota bacterium]
MIQSDVRPQDRPAVADLSAAGIAPEPSAAEKAGSSAAAGPSGEDVAQLGVSVSRLLRAFSRAKSQFLTAADRDVEWSAHVLIALVTAPEPLRVGSLAECVHSDPSTISRQVAAMVKDGLVERRADAVDGRASVLVATDKARAIYADHIARRDEHFRRMLAGWSERDCRRLATLLSRFTEDFDRYRPHFFTAPGSSAPSVATRGEN